MAIKKNVQQRLWNLECSHWLWKLCTDRKWLEHLKVNWCLIFFFNISGTAQSVGCTIDQCASHDIIGKINEGEIEVSDVSLWGGISYQIG